MRQLINSRSLIERLWRFIKRRTLYGRYYPAFADFKTAIERTVSELPTKHAKSLESLMKHNFQKLEDVSLLATRSIYSKSRP